MRHGDRRRSLPAPRRAKRHYKEQVVRLAKELRDLHEAQLKEREAWLAKERRAVDSVAWAQAALDQVRLSEESRKELAEIKARLVALQVGRRLGVPGTGCGDEWRSVGVDVGVGLRGGE